MDKICHLKFVKFCHIVVGGSYFGVNIRKSLDYCGLKYTDDSDMYNVVDEDKFTIFMLKYPECITKIVYE